jgi:hypothetical protein
LGRGRRRGDSPKSRHERRRSSCGRAPAGGGPPAAHRRRLQRPPSPCACDARHRARAARRHGRRRDSPKSRRARRRTSCGAPAGGGPLAAPRRRQRPPCAGDARHDRACDACRHVRRRDRPKSRYSSSSRRPRQQSAALNAAQGPSCGVRIARVQEGAPRSRRGDSHYGQGPRLRADPCAGGSSPCAGACVDHGAASSAQEFGL